MADVPSVPWVKIPTNMIHSAWKPLSGGTAERIRVPRTQRVAVRGIFEASPPIFLMSLTPVCARTIPATEKRTHLPTMWLRK